MSYKRSKYFLTSNKRKIKYLFLNKKSQITVVFFHGFMSDMVGEKPNTIQKFCTKKKMGFLKFEYSGHGKSSEKFTDGNISKWTNDAKQLIKAKIKGKKIINSIFKLLIKKDASLIEINPLIITKSSDLCCLDAKINFDDNALFRHPEILKLRDLNEEDPTEIEASKHDLAYIKLNGSIGCMVNGAGLAMATMDIIKLYGKEPANFLDVGGGASKEKVAEAFKIILSDKNVKGILINIFGGIMRCDVLAKGVVEAAKEIKLNVPLVVRLAGTNFEEGRKILNQSNLKILPATDLNDAAKKIVEAVG